MIEPSPSQEKWNPYFFHRLFGMIPLILFTLSTVHAMCEPEATRERETLFTETELLLQNTLGDIEHDAPTFCLTAATEGESIAQKLELIYGELQDPSCAGAQQAAGQDLNRVMGGWGQMPYGAMMMPGMGYGGMMNTTATGNSSSTGSPTAASSSSTANLPQRPSHGAEGAAIGGYPGPSSASSSPSSASVPSTTSSSTTSAPSTYSPYSAGYSPYAYYSPYSYFSPFMAIGMMQSTLQTLNKIILDSKCINNKNSKIMSTIGDLLTTFSMLGYFLPGATAGGSSYRDFIRIGGITFGSFLKMLDGFFNLPYNWNDPNDRKKFIKLTCSFYRVRVELGRIQFFRIQLGADQKNLEKMDQQAEQIKAEIDRVDRLKMQNTNLKVLAQISHFLDAYQDPDRALESDPMANFTYKRALYSQLQPVKAALQYYELEQDIKDFFPSLVYMLPPIKNLEAKDLGSRSGQQIRDNIIAPLRHLKSILESNQAQLPSPESFEMVQTEDELAKLHANSKRLHDLYDKITAEIEALKKITSKGEMNESFENNSTRLSVVDDLEKNKSFVYGEMGWSFLRYLLNEAYKSNQIFTSSYEYFKRHYIFKEYEHILTNDEWEPAELSQGCASGANILKKYERLTTLTNMIANYLDINQDLIHPNDIPTHKKLLNLLPYDSSAERWLLFEAESLNSVRSSRSQNRLAELYNEPFLSKSYSVLFGRNLYFGDILKSVDEAAGLVRLAEQFMRKNNCKAFTEAY